MIIRIINNKYQRLGGTMKYIYLMLGFIFFILGLVGVFLPILPTTPFLLLASLCFARSSKKIERWFKSTKVYKKHLESFEKDKSMTLSTKVRILSISTPMIILAIYKFPILLMRISLIILMAIKYFYFLKVIKTVPATSIKKYEINN